MNLHSKKIYHFIRNFFCLFFLICCTWTTSFGQCNCLTLPNTLTGIKNCNRDIATTFAPQVNQSVFNASLDRYVAVDFDQTLDTRDNWENAYADLALSASRSVYYAVHWTEDYWIITYSFFYPADYANSTAGCSEDEHENDLERVIIIVDKSSYCSSFPIDKNQYMGIFATHHGEFNKRGICGNSGNSFAIGLNPVNVYSAAGSHGFYLSESDALSEPGLSGTCALTPNSIDPFETSLPCYGGNSANDCYNLIDVVDNQEGLWTHRDNPIVFMQGLYDDITSYSAQKFHCNNGGGCQGILTNTAFASAPWNGSFGLNPLPKLKQECSILASQNLIFNPYYCDFSGEIGGTYQNNSAPRNLAPYSFNIVSSGQTNIRLNDWAGNTNIIVEEWKRVTGCCPFSSSGIFMNFNSSSNCSYCVFSAKVKTPFCPYAESEIVYYTFANNEVYGGSGFKVASQNEMEDLLTTKSLPRTNREFDNNDYNPISFEDKLLRRPSTKVYPNPFSDSFNISTETNRPTILIVKLMDISGRILHQQTERVDGIQNNIIISPIKKLVPGMYQVQIVDDEGNQMNHRIVYNN